MVAGSLNIILNVIPRPVTDKLEIIIRDWTLTIAEVGAEKKMFG